MTATLVHSILTWFGAGMSVVAALFWIKSTLVKVLSPDTSGWGALIGGMVVVPGPNDERLDLVGTLKQQSIWNKRAAIATAVAAALTGVAPIFQISD